MSVCVFGEDQILFLSISRFTGQVSHMHNFLWLEKSQLTKVIFSRPWGSKCHTDMNLWPLTSLCKRNIMLLNNLAMRAWWQILESYSIPRCFLNLDPICTFSAGSTLYNKSIFFCLGTFYLTETKQRTKILCRKLLRR